MEQEGSEEMEGNGSGGMEEMESLKEGMEWNGRRMEWNGIGME